VFDLSPEEIKPGRTYEGRDGKRREVYCINTARFASGPENATVSFFIQSAKYAKTVSLVEFAAWAVREVTE